MMRFGMAIKMSNHHKEAVRELDLNAAKSVSIMNDVYSFEKELKKSQTSEKDIASLCSSVDIISRECNVTAGSAKNLLQYLSGL